MIRKIFKYIILLLLILLQSSNLVEKLRIYEYIKPDIVLPFIVYISLTSTFIGSETIGFFTGFLLDILSNTLIGINAFTFTAISSLLNLFKTKVFIEKPFSVFIIIFIASIIHKVLYFLLTAIFMHKINFYQVIIKVSLPEALYTSIFAMVLFPIYNYIFFKK